MNPEEQFEKAKTECPFCHTKDEMVYAGSQKSLMCGNCNRVVVFIPPDTIFEESYM